MKKKNHLVMSLIMSLGISITMHAQSTIANNILSGVSPNPTQFLGSSNIFDAVFKTNNVERARILASNGNFGIGTASPLTKLHLNSGVFTISGSNPYGGPMMVLGPHPSNNVDTWGIELMPTGLNFWRPFLNGQSNTGNYFLFLKNTNGNVGIKTDNPTAGLTVNSNVLIGDPNIVTLPIGYKLYVEQGILTEKLKIAVKNTVNWADFVFEKDYQLMSLQEVEKFVKDNKHLPNIPSASEVEKDGIDMGHITSRLLEKIEELTLYMIEQDKKMIALQNELSKLRK
jgi:hypothetical protein